MHVLPCCVMLCSPRLGIEEPTWEELYGIGGGNGGDESHPFDDYFCKPGDDDDFMGQGSYEVRGSHTYMLLACCSRTCTCTCDTCCIHGCQTGRRGSSSCDDIILWDRAVCAMRHGAHTHMPCVQ
jgi:hypothetical protein